MNHTQDPLDLPNPQQWMDTTQALAALKVNRSTLYVMLGDGRLTSHRVGTLRIYWRPEVTRLASALRLTRARG